MSLRPSTCIINVVEDVIYIEVAGSFSKWDTHFFLVDILSPGIKKIMFCLKDTVNNNLSTDAKCTLEGEALEQVEAASSQLQTAHAALVVDASHTLDTICNELLVIRDAEESSITEPVGAEDVKCKPDPEPGNLQFESTSASPCRVLACTTRNLNPDAHSPTKPQAYHIIPFNPSDIPTQLAKRKAAVNASTGPIQKHAKLEVP
ncbi:hypothetical protein F5J12DRAFT_893460 [Pisolithus orientalis]|uniref:uncharacterized protein n=1 Tax=Pisolithus orientalis TaxID=936130 RepID=UPI0022244F00|nr:uncharacterized protein F5J12DRAFT_893460 [Pisolithus orientalis]KAI6004371.1 hypothetical protein F5J12DRAFT_893460 [Pisolithus orientalis]